MRRGQKSPLLWRGLAFHAGDGELVVPAEAVEPWLFDGAIADALAAGTLEIDPESVDVTVAGYSLSKGTLAIAGVGRDKGKGLSVERRKTYALRDRGPWRTWPACASPACRVRVFLRRRTLAMLPCFASVTAEVRSYSWCRLRSNTVARDCSIPWMRAPSVRL